MTNIQKQIVRRLANEAAYWLMNARVAESDNYIVSAKYDRLRARQWISAAKMAASIKE